MAICAAICAAAFLSWYRWGRAPSGPYSVPVTHFNDSLEGLVIKRCEVSADNSEALAYGTFNKNALGDAVEIVI